MIQSAEYFQFQLKYKTKQLINNYVFLNTNSSYEQHEYTKKWWTLRERPEVKP